MAAIGRLAASGTGGFGGEHRSHQDETRLVDDEGLQLEVLIGRKQMCTQLI
jgi:hypothetical protein